jgi:hypothetical protein
VGHSADGGGGGEALSGCDQGKLPVRVVRCAGCRGPCVERACSTVDRGRNETRMAGIGAGRGHRPDNHCLFDFLSSVAICLGVWFCGQFGCQLDVSLKHEKTPRIGRVPGYILSFMLACRPLIDPLHARLGFDATLRMSLSVEYHRDRACPSRTACLRIRGGCEADGG